MASLQSYDVPSHSLIVEADDDDDDIVAIPQSSLPADKVKGKTKAGATGSGASGAAVSGNITGSTNGRGGAIRRQNIGGIVMETRYGSGINTLDEPVMETIMRDLNAIGAKMVLILYPAGSSSSKALLRDWDLWGPLVACLGLAVILSLNAPPQQSLSVFTGIFVIVWVGSLIVTLNARLLGGRVSLLQSLCVLGYCLFPIMVAALIALFVRLLIIRVIASLGGWAWSVWAAMNFFGGTRLEDGRALLAVYPLGLLYAVLAYITMLS